MVPIRVRGVLENSLLCRVVNPDESEASGGSGPPLDDVEKGPHEVAVDGAPRSRAFCTTPIWASRYLVRL